MGHFSDVFSVVIFMQNHLSSAIDVSKINLFRIEFKMRFLPFLVILLSASALSVESEHRSIFVHNLTDSDLDIWINGNAVAVKVNSAIFSPCIHSEKSEVQVYENIQLVECGRVLEVTE